MTEKIKKYHQNKKTIEDIHNFMKYHTLDCSISCPPITPQYKINKNFSIDVLESIKFKDLSHQAYLPFKFNRIEGYFDASSLHNIKSFKNFPNYVEYELCFPYKLSFLMNLKSSFYLLKLNYSYTTKERKIKNEIS